MVPFSAGCSGCGSVTGPDVSQHKSLDLWDVSVAWRTWTHTDSCDAELRADSSSEGGCGGCPVGRR